MRWYLNDASLQGQFHDRAPFETIMRGLVGARARIPAIRQNFRSTRSLQDAAVAPQTNVRQALFQFRDMDLRRASLSWFDRTGPFTDDDRLAERDDYFEYRGVDVTETGLGEATRRIRVGEDSATFSFAGGEIDYAVDPLQVDHGLSEDRLGRYDVANMWETEKLVEHAIAVEAPARSWAALVESARRRFPNLEIGALDQNPALAREPFEASLRDQSLALMKVLNDYVAGRDDDGVEGPAARAVIETYFTGARALFTGESESNEKRFGQEMTFERLGGGSYFAPWHGKISHRFFRMHFEWPLAAERRKLEVFYLGPKITKG